MSLVTASTPDESRGMPAKDVPRWAEVLAFAATLLVCAAPLFVVSLAGWSSGVLFTGALMTSTLLFAGYVPRSGTAEPRAALGVVLALVAPLAAFAFAAGMRQDGFLPQFDAPARLLLAIPILLFVTRARVDAASRLVWVLPASLAFALASHLLFGQSPTWPADRMTTLHVDPLVFGYLSLAFSLMCLVSIGPEDRRGGMTWGLALRWLGVMLGAYLSVRSGSRTGWAAVPVVLIVWLHLNWDRRRWTATATGLLVAAVLVTAAYLFVPMVHERLGLAARELVSYSWQGVAPDNSVALRITFFRIATDLFLQHPASGIGDIQRAAADYRDAFAYASPFAVHLGFHSGFHNQLMTNAVRAGLGGLLATGAMLLVPWWICARRLRAAAGAYPRNAVVGFAFFTTIVVSSFSTEVVDLKSMASFYAVMVAVLCGAALAESPRRARALSAS